MAIVLDGTDGISTPDLESAGPVSGTTGTFSGAVSGTTGTFSGAVRASGVATDIYPLVSATAVTASGTSIDFTGIPSWVKRITVMYNGVSTNGSSPPLIQLGDSGGIENTGYNCYGISVTNASGVGGLSSTAGFIMGNASSAPWLLGGTFVVSTVNSGTSWTGSGMVCNGSAGDRIMYGAGNKTLSDTLDRIRITTVNGTDTFDAGTINILYE